MDEESQTACQRDSNGIQVDYLWVTQIRHPSQSNSSFPGGISLIQLRQLAETYGHMSKIKLTCTRALSREKKLEGLRTKDRALQDHRKWEAVDTTAQDWLYFSYLIL